MKKSRSGPRAANLVDVHFGNKIRQQRLASSMSQERFGRELGVSFQQIQKYEKGSNRVSAARLYEICQVLQTPIGSMFEGIAERGHRSARPSRAGKKNPPA
jgi:transcriptional regulator with XRE-family HTH domain